MSEAPTPSDGPPASETYEVFRRLRENKPVSREPDGPWRVARYEDVQRVLRDFKTFSSGRVPQRPPGVEERPPSMLFSDPPVHMRLRRLVSQAFSPRNIARQRDLVETRCEELVKHMCEQDQRDVIYELASPLPVTVIANMLGVADGPIRQFKQWSDAIFGNIGDILMGSPSEDAMKAAVEMDAYFLEKIAALREHEQPHLLSYLVHVEPEGKKLTDEEILMFCRLLLIAGNETTTGLIVGCVRIFHELPETFSQLKRDPALIPTFVEETVRYYSPFQLTVRRVTRDVEISGVTLREGDLVLPLIASANRDEKVFDRADQFVIDRDPNPHLAFGSGVHSCLGSNLARMEAQIAVASLAKHLDEISVVRPDTSALDEFGGVDSLIINIRRAA